MLFVTANYLSNCLNSAASASLLCANSQCRMRLSKHMPLSHSPIRSQYGFYALQICSQICAVLRSCELHRMEWPGCLLESIVRHRCQMKASFRTNCMWMTHKLYANKTSEQCSVNTNLQSNNLILAILPWAFLHWNRRLLLFATCKLHPPVWHITFLNTKDTSAAKVVVSAWWWSLDNILFVAGKLHSAIQHENTLQWCLLAQINLLPNHLCPCLPVTLDRFHQHAWQTQAVMDDYCYGRWRWQSSIVQLHLLSIVFRGEEMKAKSTHRYRIRPSIMAWWIVSENGHRRAHSPAELLQSVWLPPNVSLRLDGTNGHVPKVPTLALSLEAVFTSGSVTYSRWRWWTRLDRSTIAHQQEKSL